MKYKFLSIFVVLLTIICVGIMASGNISIGRSEEGKNIVSSQNGSKKSEKVTGTEDKKTNMNNQQSNVNKAASENNGSKVEEADKAGKDTGTKNVPETKANTSTGVGILKAGIPKEISYPTSAAVFKIEPKKLQGELTLLDKAKLLSVVTKISPVDYAKINNYLKDENYTRGIIHIFSLLKTRLCSSDYEELKNMASKYVDVDCIESYIN